MNKSVIANVFLTETHLRFSYKKKIVNKSIIIGNFTQTNQTQPIMSKNNNVCYYVRYLLIMCISIR